MMLSLLLLSASAVATTAAGLEGASSALLMESIKQQLESGGATNCQYKCANLFQINNLWDSANGTAALNGLEPGSPSAVLNEFLGCFAGCRTCKGGKTQSCQSDCKDINWYNMNWWYNPYTGGSDFFACNRNKLKLQKACVDACGIPDTGGRARLSKQFKRCTQACFDNPEWGILPINQECQANCQKRATCAGVTQSGQMRGCSTTRPSKQYTADMCGAGVLKNIIEPDKACQFGCVQNLCQHGAGCTGTGVWSSQTGNNDCQLITPQQNGQVYTIIPAIFEAPESDLAGCCSQSRVCCAYAPAWADTTGGAAQRAAVCGVADQAANCGSGVPNFNNPDIAAGAYPGDGCNTLWEANGICENAGFDPCPECRQ